VKQEWSPAPGDMVFIDRAKQSRMLHRDPNSITYCGSLKPEELAMIIAVLEKKVVLVLNQRMELGWIFGGFLRHASW